jgi:hypothetical protein
MEVDFLILADSAQVVGEKLYMLGGGWSFLRTAQMPVTHQMAVAVGILVDWLETNQRHTFRMELTQEDGGKLVAAMEGQFEQGRPPGIPAGAAQRLSMAFTFAPTLDAAGPYAVRLLLNGQVAKRVGFVVAPPPGAPAMPPPAPG